MFKKQEQKDKRRKRKLHQGRRQATTGNKIGPFKAFQRDLCCRSTYVR